MDVATLPLQASPSPWRTMWFAPRSAIRGVVDAELRPNWWPVVALAALNHSFLAMQVDPLGGGISPSASAMPVIVSALQVVFAVLVGPYLLAIVGGWLGGDADPADIRHALAWSYLPHAVFGLCWVPCLLVFGGPPAAQLPDGPFAGVASLMLLGMVGALIWSVVMEVITLAEVQRFSIVRSIASIAILMAPYLVLNRF